MPTSSPAYGSIAAATITLAGLAAGSARESTAIDNTALGAMDVELEIEIALAAGTIGDLSRVDVFLVPSLDGAKWPSPATGVNAGIAVATDSPIAGHQIGVLSTPTASVTVIGVFRTALWYDGALCLAPFFSVVLSNRSGVAFTSGAVRYRPVNIQSE